MKYKNYTPVRCWLCEKVFCLTKAKVRQITAPNTLNGLRDWQGGESQCPHCGAWDGDGEEHISVSVNTSRERRAVARTLHGLVRFRLLS